MHHSQLTSFSRTIKQCEVQRQRCRLVTACCVIQWQQPNRMQTWTSQLRTGQLSTFASSLAHWSSQDSCSFVRADLDFAHHGLGLDGWCLGLGLEVDPKDVAYSLRRLACNPYGWLAGLSHGLGLLVAYGGWWRLTMAYGYKQEN